MKCLLLTALFILLISSYQADCNVTIKTFSKITSSANTNTLATNICLLQQKTKSTRNKVTPFDNWDAKMMIW